MVPDCMEWLNSQVRVKKCWLDIAQGDLWIHIYHAYGVDYTGSKNLIVKTVNYAIKHSGVGNTAFNLNIQIKMF